MKWYELEEKDRIKEFYSKYTIKDFWGWWSSNQDGLVLEVRIRDIPLIKETANKYNLNYSFSGVYVKSAEELKAVIGFVRDKATIWFGINGRKKNYSANTKFKTFSSGARQGSSDDNIESIGFIFIDIDRKIKGKPASNKELENCDILANKILERMAIQKWTESYIKICSGNGLQLLIKLDVQILLPTRTFNNEKKYFEHSDEFDRLKVLIKTAIGTPLKQHTGRFEGDLGVEVDLSGFNLNRVGGLPASKNFKYDSFQWRGIVEMRDGINIGLSDYILSKINDIEVYKAQNVFVKSRIINKNIIKPGKLREHPIVKLLMENDLKEGSINNKVWFSLKCVLRDSKFDMNSDEFRDFHKELEAKYHGRFTTNFPTPEFSFSEDVVNSFCINNVIPPIYKLWANRTKKLNMKLEEMKWGVQNMISESMELDMSKTIQEDMQFVKDKLIEGDCMNMLIIAKFVNGCMRKYGKEKAKYYVDYLFERFFNYA